MPINYFNDLEGRCCIVVNEIDAATFRVSYEGTGFVAIALLAGLLWHFLAGGGLLTEVGARSIRLSRTGLFIPTIGIDQVHRIDASLGGPTTRGVAAACITLAPTGDGDLDHRLQGRVEQYLHQAIGRVVGPGRLPGVPLGLVAGGEGEAAVVGRDDGDELEEALVDAAELLRPHVAPVHAGEAGWLGELPLPHPEDIRATKWMKLVSNATTLVTTAARLRTVILISF